MHFRFVWDTLCQFPCQLCTGSLRHLQRLPGHSPQKLFLCFTFKETFFFFLSFESFEHSSCSGRLVQLVWKFSFDSALPHFLRGRGPDACGDDLALVGSRSPSEDLQQAGDGLVAPPALCLS